MPRDEHKIIGAIFDVKPVDKNGLVDFDKINDVEPVLCLKETRRDSQSLADSWQDNNGGQIEIRVVKFGDAGVDKSVSENDENNAVRSKASYVTELEKVLGENLDTSGELSSVGAVMSDRSVISRPRIRPISSNQRKAETIVGALSHENVAHARIIAEIGKRSLPETKFIQKAESSREKVTLTNNIQPGDMRKAEIDLYLGHLYKNKVSRSARLINSQPVPILSKISKIIKTKKFYVIVVAILAIGALAYSSLGLKNQIMTDGNSAVQNLEEAKRKIENMDFIGASGSFSKAYEEFTKASGNLNFMGASIGSLIADLPGASKMKSANSILEAGKLLADAGQAMTLSMDYIAKSGSILNPTSNDGSMVKMLDSLRGALVVAQRNLLKADTLLATIDEQSLPQDKQAGFSELRLRLPEFKELIDSGVDYSKFLEDMVGVKGSKKYLLMFQNPAELRATGGFPGSYGTITFKDGQMNEFFVDDIYNLDGQLKENIIPPVQMQHITPTWGMRDANWFVDFPTSAKKIMSFYKKESGTDVDGVITFSPVIVAKLLDIVGPIEMPEYGLVLNSQNFATEIQDEVEYGNNRTQPKQVLKDMAPKLLAKMYLANKDEWMEIFRILITSMENKNVLMYFKNLSLQSFAYDKGFTGSVKSVPDDYLMVNVTNVKGSKTDNVTDTTIKIDTKLIDEGAIHKLTIIRKHNGGDKKYGFYNKQNPSYVRVLVPEGSELTGISGNVKPNFKPLISYNKAGFKIDADLEKLESSAVVDIEKGVSVQREAGKAEFAFWMIMDPGQEEVVEINYITPRNVSNNSYNLYVQKQPGLVVNNFEFSLDNTGGRPVSSSSPTLNKADDKYILSGKLENDLPINIDFE